MKKLTLLLMITSILSFFICGKKASEDNVKTIFNEEIFNKTSDAKLLETVYENIVKKLSKNSEQEYESVMKLSKSEQAIYIIWALEGEVNNGGYNQFYFNSSGKFAELIPKALKLVGATKFAELTEKANRIYKTENDKITKHQDGTIEGFSKSYDENPLNELDDAFYKLYEIENLQNLQIEYIRKNKNEFIAK